MKTIFKCAFVTLLVVAAIGLTWNYVTHHDIAVLNSSGMIGVKESDLILTSTLLMLIVVIPVFGLAAFFAWRYRASNTIAVHAPDWEHNYIAEYCWWGVPLIIIGILAVITWKSSHELNPFKPIVTEEKSLKIQVVALQWKWLFIYPEHNIATINFVQFPEKTPIDFEITADAPMNSFWIPKLGGQIYAMPAMRTKLHLIADETGDFRGVSSNISGEGFSGMTFTAKATSKEDFETWIQSAKAGQKNLDLNTYNQLVEPSSYDPVATYTLTQENLFDHIIMKYMEPTE
jgi:cytochrome o ubiquinol oxidase subunit II